MKVSAGKQTVYPCCSDANNEPVMPFMLLVEIEKQEHLIRIETDPNWMKLEKVSGIIPWK
jgi:hypothetical protein